MYCKIFTGQQVYDGMTEMNIACDNVFVTDGWICLYKDEKFVASFDMVTINGWVLIDSTADTPQTDWEKEKSEKSLCNSCGKDCDNRKRNLYVVECNRYEPQTDCGWK